MKSLRHESTEMTEEAYQDVKARETAEDVDEILDDGTSGDQREWHSLFDTVINVGVAV